MQTFAVCSTEIQVGNSHRTSFCEDPWMNSGSPQEAFFQLYSITTATGVKISTAWEDTGANHQWNVNVRRNLNDGEMQEFLQFSRWLDTTSLIHEKKMQEGGDGIGQDSSQSNQLSRF